MAGTDVYQYKDATNVTTAKTYYGNGCPNATEEEGSRISCSNRTVQTFDEETQKIGTYYNFSAASSESGTSSPNDETNAPDTFCPLGWQLPYSGTGGDYYDKSRSWNYLFGLYNYSDGRVLQLYPLSYVRSGTYYWGSGILYGQGVAAQLWSLTYVQNKAFWLLFGDWVNIRQDAVGKLNGRAIRCVLDISNLTFHGIRETSLYGHFCGEYDTGYY